MKILSEIFCQFFGTEEIMDTKAEFDIVKYEKQKAMARFNMFQRMKRSFQVFELLVLLVLISWSANKIPSVAKLFVDLFSELWFFLQKPHVVFVMVICIVLVLVVLCKKNEVEYEYRSDELHDEYALYKDYSEECEVVEIQPIPEGGDEKDVKEEMQVVVAVDKRCDGLEEAIAEAEKRIRRFERTQSEKLRRDIGVRPRKELRRSETENGRGVVGGGDRRIVKSVDHLSNDEFKIAVEEFINKHRVFFKQQKIAEF